MTTTVSSPVLLSYLNHTHKPDCGATGFCIILYRTLAELLIPYDPTTNKRNKGCIYQKVRVNQAVIRNEQKFPSDFMFRLTKEEKHKLVTNCDRVDRLKPSHGVFGGHTYLKGYSYVRNKEIKETMICSLSLQLKTR